MGSIALSWFADISTKPHSFQALIGAPRLLSGPLKTARAEIASQHESKGANFEWEPPPSFRRGDPIDSDNYSWKSRQSHILSGRGLVRPDCRDAFERRQGLSGFWVWNGYGMWFTSLLLLLEIPKTFFPVSNSTEYLAFQKPYIWISRFREDYPLFRKCLRIWNFTFIIEFWEMVLAAK